MAISRKEIEHIASLARLDSTGGIFDRLADDMQGIVAMVDKLAELDLGDITDVINTERKNASQYCLQFTCKPIFLPIFIDMLNIFKCLVAVSHQILTHKPNSSKYFAICACTCASSASILAMFCFTSSISTGSSSSKVSTYRGIFRL